MPLKVDEYWIPLAQFTYILCSKFGNFPRDNIFAHQSENDATTYTTLKFMQIMLCYPKNSIKEFMQT